ncbi:uncharacterized protein LOC110861734 [Folsomia candida]|uniref:uncharacterized protein LOC110861734 n=1 Tax=Folsomia candida TaxID=158441 RepID=UPI000B8F856B|nr:uncharacterized protein LOC110861734 [Folsomia candida]
MITSSLILLLLLQSTFFVAGDVPCGLTFVSWTSESDPPSNAVDAGESGSGFIARFRVSPGNVWTGGRLTAANEAVSVYNNVVENNNAFEVLTNPSNCSIRWGGSINKFTVKFDTTSFVGRYCSPMCLAGKVDEAMRINYVNDNLQAVTRTTNVMTLEAFTSGFTISMNEFKMDANNGANKVEFLGLDVINNNSPATVKQSVTHKKKLKQTLEVEYGGAEGFGAAFSKLNFAPQLSFRGSGGPVIDMSQSLVGKNPSKTTTTEESEVNMEREVELGPFNAVHICSTLSVAENFEATYTSKAVASGVGLSAEEVQSYLVSVGDRSWSIQDGRVVKTMSGVIKGTAGLSGQYTVVPTDDPYGCTLIEALIRQNQKLEGQRATNATAGRLMQENFYKLKSMLKFL